LVSFIDQVPAVVLGVVSVVKKTKLATKENTIRDFKAAN